MLLNSNSDLGQIIDNFVYLKITVIVMVGWLVGFYGISSFVVI